ncbi:MAG: matrixin family metalloprotease [Candidatus Acidiferrales bacterium]
MRLRSQTRSRRTAGLAGIALLVVHLAGPMAAGAYSLNYQVADMRQAASVSGGTSCPQPTRFDTSVAGGINRLWSTSLSTNPVTILTADQTASGQLAEIESTIEADFGIWTGVTGTTLSPSALAPLGRTNAQDACDSTDGLNTICFNQSDPAFTTGVLSFTRVTIADIAGEQAGPEAPTSSFAGQILDADILLRPADSSVMFATPAALAANPNAYDLETILAHELGHFFGLGHSGVWSAMMQPFALGPGEFLGSRPTAQAPDAPLADDDRTGLRVLYPDPADTTHIGVIAGRVLPANPQELAAGTTGIFGAQVVAVDAATGAVEAAAIGGWSCADPGPPQFDGSYEIQRLPVGAAQAYIVYAEPLDGPLEPSDIPGATTALCRNAITDASWPAQYACTVPAVNSGFSTTVRAGP